VDFIVELLEPLEDELICDPCAGSGGFLIKAFESVSKQINNEFVAIKKAKQKEIFGEELENIDDKKLQKEYEQFVEEQNKLQEAKIEKLSHKSIFGTDANPRMARVSKMNMIMHGDGHNGIHHNDGLLNVNGIFRERFDMIITNPPFGTNLDKKSPVVEEDDKYSNEEMIAKYIKEYGDTYTQEMKQVTDNINEPIRSLFEVGKSSGATEVLFIERCLDLLKAGGRMGIVLPEGVLNSSNLQSAREYFESRAKIILIVSLPQDIFISSGATVKTSLVFFKKFTEQEAREYKSIKERVTQEIEDEFYDDINPIEEQLKLRGKEAPSKEAKKELRAKLKELNTQKETQIKEAIKEQFDYQIPIADIKKAGISTTGAVTDNELPQLLKVYTQYRKEKKLWESKADE